MARRTTKKAAKRASAARKGTTPGRIGKARATGKKHAPALPAGASGSSATIRHYCQGIGDCHLLTFSSPDGPTFRVLIDCGLHSIVTGGTRRIAAIAANIKEVCGDQPIDVLVVTHEHWDHVSGFTTAADIFKTIKFGEVWLPWTEKPGDPLAEKLDKYKGQALSALALASRRLALREGPSGRSALRAGLDSVLGFHFGAAGDNVRAARNAAAGLVPEAFRKYLEPGGPPLAIDCIPNLRIFVLGPPRDPKLLKLEESQAEMYQFGARGPGWSDERLLSAAFSSPEDGGDDWSAPFNENIGQDLDALLAGKVADTGKDADQALDFFLRHYSGDAPPKGNDNPHHLADQSWRRIDDDWLGIAADLAMRLDAGINNTSLVLAFEFIDTGRVLLFPGDAQIGSWKSWQPLQWEIDGRVVTLADLLARTVYLKVAHHGSQNATPHRLGLEQMTNGDLSAFIPVNQADAKKARWHAMPFDKILTELVRRTGGRVIRADDKWTLDAGGQPSFSLPAGSIRAVRNKGEGWVELDVG